jgi:hypothetical protein
VNHATASHEHLDLIIGFQTGDLIWFGGLFYSTPLQLNTNLIGHRPVLVTIWAVKQAGKTFGEFPRLDEIDTYRRVAYRIHPARPCVGCHPPRISSSYHTRTAQSLCMTKTAMTVYLPHNLQPLPRCPPCVRHLTLPFLLPRSRPLQLASGIHWTASSSQSPHGTL